MPRYESAFRRDAGNWVFQLSYCGLLLFHQQDFLRVIDLAKFYLNNLIFRRLHRSSNESSLNRQFPMTSVDQYAKLQAFRTARPEQRVHGGTRGAAGIKHVVNQHHRLTCDRNLHLVFLHHGLGAKGRKIVAIESNVERAEQDRFLFDALNNLRQPLRQRNSTTPDADISCAF